MKKNYLQTTWRLKKLYGKFYNFQKRLRMLMQTGDYYDFSFEKQNRLMRRLNLLFDRLTLLIDKKRLKWASASVALLVSISVSGAEFGNPIDISGVKADYFSSPVFVDVDEDNSIDLVVGQQAGNLLYFQIEEGVFIERVDSLNPFDTLSISSNSSPTFADLDDDGDLDLLVGNYFGTLQYFKNNNSVFEELTGGSNPFDGFDVGDYASPSFADVDDDGDLDLLVGAFDSTAHFFLNELGFTEKTGSENPFDGIIVGNHSKPLFVDYDEDGDPDLFIGEQYGKTLYYRNNSGVYFLQNDTDNPVNDLDIGYRSAPAFFDLDGDLDLEFISGEKYGNLMAYNNISNSFEKLEGWDSPFYGIRTQSTVLKPTFADIDNDGDDDLITGEHYGTISLFSNIDGQLIEVADSINPFDGFDVGENSSPFFVDLDEDGDLDLLAGNYEGGIKYFKNSVGVYTEQTGVDNPFDGIDVDSAAAPVMADIDLDGDLDLFVGSKYGTIHYYEDNGGVYTEMFDANNPLSAVDLSFSSCPSFIDLDEDGDLDLFIGQKYGGIYYYENEGGVFTELTGVDNPLEHVFLSNGSGPSFADIDEDGDMDAFIGDTYGKLHFIANGSTSYHPSNYVVDGSIDDGGGTTVSETQLEGVSLYTANSILFIESNEQIIDRVQVYNLSGQMVIEKAIGNSGLNQISLERLSTGAYLVRAISGQSSTSKKVLISK